MLHPALDTYRRIVEQILTPQLQALTTEYAAHLQCGKGCFGCCRDGFKIRVVEAMALWTAFAQVAPEVRSRLQAQLLSEAASNAGAGGACPVLLDGLCALYDSRPVLCRAFGLILSLNGETGTCELNFQTVEPGHGPLKILTLDPYYDLLDELSQRLWTDCRALSPSLPETPPLLSIRQYFALLASMAGVVSDSTESFA